MIQRVTRRIRGMPWKFRIIAWPAFALALLPYACLQAAWWALSEMGGRAHIGAKQVLAPMLWPSAGIAVVAILAAITSPEGVILLGVLLAGLVVMLFGLRYMMAGIWPMKAVRPVKKKRRRP